MSERAISRVGRGRKWDRPLVPRFEYEHEYRLAPEYEYDVFDARTNCSAGQLRVSLPNNINALPQNGRRDKAFSSGSGAPVSIMIPTPCLPLTQHRGTRTRLLPRTDTLPYLDLWFVSMCNTRVQTARSSVKIAASTRSRVNPKNATAETRFAITNGRVNASRSCCSGVSPGIVDTASGASFIASSPATHNKTTRSDPKRK